MGIGAKGDDRHQRGVAEAPSLMACMFTPHVVQREAASKAINYTMAYSILSRGKLRPDECKVSRMVDIPEEETRFIYSMEQISKNEWNFKVEEQSPGYRPEPSTFKFDSSGELISRERFVMPGTISAHLRRFTAALDQGINSCQGSLPLCTLFCETILGEEVHATDEARILRALNEPRLSAGAVSLYTRNQRVFDILDPSIGEALRADTLNKDRSGLSTLAKRAVEGRAAFNRLVNA